MLRKLGKQNIRKFLSDRAAYVREIGERNKQNGEAKGTPVSLVFSIDPSLLASLVDLRRLGRQMYSVDKVSDAVLQKRLEDNSCAKKDGLSTLQVNAIISKRLRINMTEKDTEQRIVMLFADYTSLLRVNGLLWIIEDSPNSRLATYSTRLNLGRYSHASAMTWSLLTLTSGKIFCRSWIM